MNRGCIVAALCAGVLSSAALADVTGSAGAGAPVPTVQPSLGVNYLIRTTGMCPSENGSPVGSLGEIIQFAGNFAPDGYAAANGQLLPISQNTALFSLLGTTYGGNGQTTFALPDMRSRVPIHPGQGPGLSPYSLGQNGGTESTSLTVGNLPAHNHPATLNAAGADADQNKPAGNSLATTTGNTYSAVAPSSAMNSGAVVVGLTGGNQPVPIIQPYLCVNFIIALEGIFPSRN